MIKIDAINLTNPEKIMVAWHTGYRCNYDCTYCEATRHDNHSHHQSYESFIKTFHFVKEYTQIYGHYVNIDFTGGEPTVNPAFWDFAEHVVNTEDRFRLSLTTNGAWHPKNSKRIADIFGGVTVSYHAEADPKLKSQVLENIKLLHETGIWIQVNVMMHVDYFEECVDVCNRLKDLGIMHKPIPIGDGNIERSGWFFDTDGTPRRTSHDYTPEQQEWYFKYIGVSAPATNSREGTQLGRSCCGRRCLKGLSNNEWKDVTYVDTFFKGWYCSVNKYFLYIDQQKGEVYHHQTCKALHNGERGPIGTLENTDAIIDYALEHKDQAIVCPNDRCGCGMCVPKAKEWDVYKTLV